MAEAEGGKRPGETRDWEEREERRESVSEDSLQGANRGTLCTPVAGPKAECQANTAMQYNIRQMLWGLNSLRTRTGGICHNF